jgi:hypothetical protein
MQLSEQAAERLVREMQDTLQALDGELELLLTYKMPNGKTRSLASLVDKLPKPEQPKYRPDKLIAGSREAVERMAELVSQGKEVCLFSGQAEDDNAAITEDDIELMKGCSSLFKGV